MSRVLVGVKRVIDYAVKVSENVQEVTWISYQFWSTLDFGRWLKNWFQISSPVILLFLDSRQARQDGGRDRRC